MTGRIEVYFDVFLSFYDRDPLCWGDIYGCKTTNNIFPPHLMKANVDIDFSSYIMLTDNLRAFISKN